LILLGDSLYGTASHGGTSRYGTVFTLNRNGTGFTNLHTFAGTDGYYPSGPLAQAGGIIYGTTEAGLFGAPEDGQVYAVNYDGSNFTNLHGFSGDHRGGSRGVILSGNTLYGTRLGDLFDSLTGGSVFKLNIDGTGFSSVHDFEEGQFLFGGLILSGNALYGTTGGTVFKVNTDGTGFATLWRTTDTTDGYLGSGVILSGETLYGTSAYSGLWTNGSVFKVKTDGTGFAILHTFTGGSDGANPLGDLILAGNTIYGTTTQGGGSGYGTVFSITIPPELTFVSTGPNFVLSWPTNFTGFALQSTTNLGPSPIWTTNLAAPVIINGQFKVTNPISGTQQFFRLSQ
jgi:uncharacterized repeat protein (TIGR03803 family)